MKSYHWIEDAALEKVIADVLRDAVRRGQNPQAMAASVERRIESFLARQPLAPTLVGVGEASEMIGLPKPRIARLREQGRMPEPIAELAAGPVWIQPEVEELAATLARERAARTARKEAASVNGSA